MLSRRNFSLLWLAWMISLAGDWVLLAALPFYVYIRTGSTLATGVMFMAETLPALLIGPVAGVFVDRWDRRATLVIGSIVQGACVLLLLLVSAGSWLWLVYLSAFVEKAIAQFTTPAGGALLPRVVEDNALVPANSTVALGSSIVGLVGPSIGGAALVLLGLPVVVILDSASFLVAGALVALISLSREPQGQHARLPAGVVATWTGVWQDWWEGWWLLRKDPLLPSLFVVKAVAGFGQGIITVLLVVFVREVLVRGAVEFGWLLSAQGMGGIIGGLLVARASKRIGPARLLAYGLGAAGVLFLAVINVGVLWLALVLFAAIGVCIVGWTVSEWTILQRSVADPYRGRVLSAYLTTYALMTLSGMGVASALTGLFGVVPLLDLAGVLYLLAGGVALVRVDSGVAWDNAAAMHVRAVEGLLVEELGPFLDGRGPLADRPDLASDMDAVLELMALDGVDDERYLAEYVRALLRPANSPTGQTSDDVT
jgi:MFS family permease